MEDMSMVWNNLKRQNEAPKSGYIMAYTRKKVIFHSFTTLLEVEQELLEEELLELHLFDREKEYRAVSTRSKRYPDGVIEAIVDFSEELEQEIYAEDILLETPYQGKITVLHHLQYDEKTGIAFVDNYRLLKKEVE